MKELKLSKDYSIKVDSEYHERIVEELDQIIVLISLMDFHFTIQPYENKRGPGYFTNESIETMLDNLGLKENEGVYILSFYRKLLIEKERRSFTLFIYYDIDSRKISGVIISSLVKSESTRDFRKNIYRGKNEPIEERLIRYLIALKEVL